MPVPSSPSPLGALSPRARLGASLLIGALLLLAWHNRFIQDDAFISFRYADNLARGHGLVWNSGEPRVEGYTNFLWTLLIAGGIALGLEPVGVSYLLGLAAFLASLVLVFSLGHRLFRRGEAAFIAVALVGTNYSFSAYASGGLETQLQTALVLGVAWLLLRGVQATRWDTRTTLALSFAAAAALLTRLDSAVFVGPCVALAAADAWRRRETRRSGLLALAALGLPALIIVSTWLLWKVSYYGGVLPNTFYVKGTRTAVSAGLSYVGQFFRSYFLLPLPLAVAVAWWRDRRTAPHGALGALTLVSLGWLVYVVKVGGDFMEFRLLVPVLPFICLLATHAILTLVPLVTLRLLLVALIATGSLVHARTFKSGTGAEVESVEELARHVRRPLRGWISLGLRLRELFDEGSGVRIAVTPAGAIPYYSRLASVDMLGLNDAWIAREGPSVRGWSGHSRGPTWAYLRSRGVHLVIAHPYVTPNGLVEGPELRLDNWTTFIMEIRDLESLPTTVPLLEIPMDEARWWRVLYLTPHPLVDARIRTLGWPVHVLSNPAYPSGAKARSLAESQGITHY